MLLRTRSILAQASLLVLITLARSQNYDSEYNVESEAEDHSSFSEDAPKRPDYTKYYSVDSNNPNAAQLQDKSDGGFVAPLEFTSFFGTPQFSFGASNNQEILKPLVAETKQEGEATGFVSDKDFQGGFSAFNNDGFGSSHDYFEQAQRQQQKEEQDEEGAEQKPGPSYVSHRIPAKKGRYESDVEILQEKPSSYESSKSKNSKAKVKQDEEALDEEEDEKANFDFKPSPPLNLAEFQPTNPSKILEEVVGKSSQLPYNPEYYTKLVQPQATPYQKYSFQPAATNFGLKEASILNAFQSTAAPFNPSYAKTAAASNTNFEHQPSETVSQNIRGKECIRVHREVSDQSGKFKNQPMNCFVCKDPKSGAKSEQCSYSNEPNPKSYYTSTSQSFGTPEPYRAKRDESKSYSDPYEEIKAKSHDYYSKPDEFEKEYYKAPDFSKFSEGYSYNPETLNDKEAEEKSYSEIQSAQLLKKGENCHKSHKNGVTCTVCKDAATGANFEQCSYESAPNEKKYAYVKESKFDGDGNPIEEKETGSTVPQPVVNEDSEKFSPLRRSDEAAEESDEAEETRTSENQEDEQPKTSKLIDDYQYDIPSHFAESTYKQQKAGVRGLDPELYGSADGSEKSEESDTAPQRFTNLDEYHLKLFPHLANQETKKEETRTQPDKYFEDLSGKKDVEKVLEEFTKKDRSNCKQVSKKGMTCYLCVDKKGMQQEECMYVSESRPKSSHVAYHEVQHIKAPQKENHQTESKVEESEPSESQKKKQFVKKVEPADSTASASNNYETRVKFTPYAAASANVYQKLPKNKRGAKSEDVRDKDRLDESQDPKPEFDVEDEGGLYSAETRPVYSKALGLALPRYMLEKSDIEQEFDRSVSEE